MMTLDGTTPSSQPFVLPGRAPFWTNIKGAGWRYSDPTGANGPVRLLIVKRVQSTSTFRAIIAGTGGMIDVVPPNTGSSAFVELAVDASSVCTTFGGAAGGTIKRNDETRFVVMSPIQVPCS